VFAAKECACCLAGVLVDSRNSFWKKKAFSNLAVSGGVEMSRKQLDYLRDFEEREETRKIKKEEEEKAQDCAKEGESSDLPDQRSSRSARDILLAQQGDYDNDRHRIRVVEEDERKGCGTLEKFDA